MSIYPANFNASSNRDIFDVLPDIIVKKNKAFKLLKTHCEGVKLAYPSIKDNEEFAQGEKTLKNILKGYACITLASNTHKLFEDTVDIDSRITHFYQTKSFDKKSTDTEFFRSCTDWVLTIIYDISKIFTDLKKLELFSSEDYICNLTTLPFILSKMYLHGKKIHHIGSNRNLLEKDEERKTYLCLATNIAAFAQQVFTLIHFFYGNAITSWGMLLFSMAKQIVAIWKSIHIKTQDNLSVHDARFSCL